MTGRVLSEQMITRLEQSVDNEMVQDLIATILERDKKIADMLETENKYNRACHLLDKHKRESWEYQQQNTILCEALETIQRKVNANDKVWLFFRMKNFVSAALAKVEKP